MNNPKIIIIIAVVAFLLIVGILFFIIRKVRKNSMNKKIDELDIMRNEILSIPLQNQIDKAYGFAKGEQIEEKVNHYKETYENIKKVSFKEIDNMITELDFIINSNRRSEFNEKYTLIEIELTKNRYLINHMIEEIKELTSYEDKYRGIIIKLKNKYRVLTREFESNKEMYGVFVDTISMQFENIEKRFNDFETVINENLYNEVVLVVHSLEGMIDHIGVVILELPDILVLVNDLIPSRLKDLDSLRHSMAEDGFTLQFMNLDYNEKEIERIENDIVDRTKVLNIDNSLLELKTILEFLDSLFKDIEKEKIYKKDFDITSSSFNDRVSTVKKTLHDMNSQLEDIKSLYGLKSDDLKDLENITGEYDVLVKEYRSLIRRVKKQEESFGKFNKNLNELGIRLKRIEDNLDLTLKNLGSMQDDEERAREQLEEVQELLKTCKKEIQSVRIPVVANNYFVELGEANEAILEIIKELEKKPIIIKVLNTRVDTARDLVFKLYNTTKNIVNNAYYAENLIVYANRYRNISEVNKILNKAEIMFYKGNYEGSLKVVLDIVNKYEPGIKEKINKVIG